MPAPVPRDTLLAVADQVIAAYNARDPVAIQAYRTPGCRHQVLPASLARPEMSGEEYAAFFGRLMSLFSRFGVTVHDVYADAEGGKVVIHATSKGDTPIGEYGNEYMLVLEVVEVEDPGRGEKVGKVDRFLEFVDSHTSKDFLPRLFAWAKENGKME